MTGKELRRRRMSLGLSQIQFAKEIDVVPNTVSRWESGSIPTVPKTVELSLEALEFRLSKIKDTDDK
jgi:transcriptional regulator with XRE-family HTH domain